MTIFDILPPPPPHPPTHPPVAPYTRECNGNATTHDVPRIRSCKMHIIILRKYEVGTVKKMKLANPLFFRYFWHIFNILPPPPPPCSPHTRECDGIFSYPGCSQCTYLLNAHNHLKKIRGWNTENNIEIYQPLIFLYFWLFSTYWPPVAHYARIETPSIHDESRVPSYEKHLIILRKYEVGTVKKNEISKPLIFRYFWHIFNKLVPCSLHTKECDGIYPYPGCSQSTY